MKWMGRMPWLQNCFATEALLFSSGSECVIKFSTANNRVSVRAFLNLNENTRWHIVCRAISLFTLRRGGLAGKQELRTNSTAKYHNIGNMKSVKVPRRRPSTTTAGNSYNIKLQGMIFDPPVLQLSVLLLTGMSGNKPEGGVKLQYTFYLFISSMLLGNFSSGEPCPRLDSIAVRVRNKYTGCRGRDIGSNSRWESLSPSDENKNKQCGSWKCIKN